MKMMIQNSFDISLLILLFLILNVCSANGDYNNTTSGHKCAKYNEICHPYYPQPCCDDNLSCKIKKSRNDFVCTEKVILKATCGNDDDCSDIKHAKCSDDKDCTCIIGYSSVNKTYCAPSLNSFCWRDEKCATDHASCINSRCQCNENYLQHSPNECLPKLIGSFCKDNSECSRVKYAQCSAGNICVCSINTKSVDRALCLPVLNEYCETNNDCKVENSICIDNKCQCKPNHMTLLNECQAPHLGMPCKHSGSCYRFINNSLCSDDDRKCTCLPSYLPVNQNKCLAAYNQYCLDHEQCATENSICLNRRCQCKPYYVYRGLQCVLPYLQQWCQKEEDCSGVKFATCSKDNICVCKRNYFQSDDSTCSTLLKSSCSTTKECFVANSVCQNGKCQCAENFFAKSNDRCAKIFLVQTCSIFYDCLTIPHSYCSESGLCYCDLGYVSIDGIKCVPALGQFCTKSKPCAINNSNCIDNKCQCKPYFEEARDSECVPINFNKTCSYDIDCRDIKHSMCFHGECTCKQNYAPVNSQTCVLLLGGFCYKNEDCYVKNSVCVSNICQCDTEHLAVNDDKCEPIMLGTLCLTNDDCDKIDNSICSADNVCTCNLNYRALNKFVCVPILNGFCSEDSQCPTDSFRCVDHQCQCQPNFTAMSASQCFETNLINTCTNVTECSDSWHTQCTPDHKCVCAPNNMALSLSTCLPVLNGYCWRDNQCMAENSVCTDFHCACKPNFIAVAHNLCIPDRKKMHLY